MTNSNCEICGKPATSWMLRDPFGKSDATRPLCAEHAPQFHNPTDVIEITQLRGNLSLAEEGLANYALEAERKNDLIDAQDAAQMSVHTECVRLRVENEQLQSRLEGSQAAAAVGEREIAALQQFKEWAEPQIVTHGQDMMEIERLRAKLHSVRARCLNLAQWIDKGCDPKHGATEASFIALFAKEPSSEPLRCASESRFTVEANGRLIYDDDFGYDAKLTLDGDWPDDSHRLAYAQAVRDALNKSMGPLHE